MERRGSAFLQGAEARPDEYQEQLMRCKLQVLEGEDAKLEFDLVGERILLGRDEECDIAIFGSRVGR
jgi:hypothetical protein